MNKLIDRYNQLPKWFRFSAYFFFYPVWMPVAVIACGLAICVLGLITAVIQAWEEFK